jgi:solute carrier family 25 (mitochondrial 2-oxodicarboxylate transporter), member 21
MSSDSCSQLVSNIALPFWANFTAGAIAGVTEILLMYPLDVVKTRMQLETGSKSVGLVGSFRTIIAQEGYVKLISILITPPFPCCPSGHKPHR